MNDYIMDIYIIVVYKIVLNVNSLVERGKGFWENIF